MAAVHLCARAVIINTPSQRSRVCQKQSCKRARCASITHLTAPTPMADHRKHVRARRLTLCGHLAGGASMTARARRAPRAGVLLALMGGLSHWTHDCHLPRRPVQVQERWTHFGRLWTARKEKKRVSQVPSPITLQCAENWPYFRWGTWPPPTLSRESFLSVPAE